MNKVLLTIRPFVLILSLTLMTVVCLTIILTIPAGDFRTISLTRSLAVLSGVYLYLTLLIGPIAHLYTSRTWVPVIIKARRSMGISAWIFGGVHGFVAFFYQLGGVEGLPFLSNRYLFAISLGWISFILMTILAITSFDSMIAQLGARRWKWIHRAIYVIGMLTLGHAFLMGSHFTDFTKPLTQLIFYLISILLILEMNRVDSWLSTFWPRSTKYHPSVMMTVVVSLGVLLLFIKNPTNPFSLSNHPDHQFAIENFDMEH